MNEEPQNMDFFKNTKYFEVCYSFEKPAYSKKRNNI